MKQFISKLAIKYLMRRGMLVITFQNAACLQRQVVAVGLAAKAHNYVSYNMENFNFSDWCEKS